MIKSLKIKGYTLLKDVSIDFKDGFTIISGETGAGKSIMLDALSLLLGKRVARFSDAGYDGKTIIEGVFSVKKSKESFFESHNIDFDAITVVRREINAEGRSRAFINDTPVLLSVLLEFGNQIIEIHSQHQSVLLKDKVAQFALIDELAGSKSFLIDYQRELQKYRDLNTELVKIKESGSLSDSEIEFLKYQLNELNDLNLKKGEKASIEQQITLLENVEGIANVVSESEYFLNNEQGILSQLSDVKRKLADFETLSDLYERVTSVIIELNDVSSDLYSLTNNIRSNPQELSTLSNRLDNINQLLQKHKKKSVDELLDCQNDIQTRIDLSVSFELEVERKEAEIKEQALILEKKALILNDKRVQALPNLQKDIEAHLINLGMPFAKFLIDVSVVDAYHQFGNTSLSFLFSANKGGKLLDISKVASGGELSRLMLSIKYIAAQYSEIDTLVFDEIDMGVSGEIASLMGDMMKKIRNSTQLIAISHLPQIASKADEHLKVVKKVVANETISDVLILDKDGRLEEIAKLLSGKEVTSAAFENARALLNQ